MESQGRPWDRQTDGNGKPEPILWFSRFESYRLLGPKRSLLAVYNKEREKAGKSGAKRTPSSWDKQARAWNWQGRAEAWDAAEAERERLEREAEERRLREQARQTRRSLLGVGHNLLAKATLVYMGKDAAIPDVQTVLRLLSAIEKFNKDSREEYGDIPAQDINVRGVVGAVGLSADDMAQARDSIFKFEQELLGGRESTDPDNH